MTRYVTQSFYSYAYFGCLSQEEVILDPFRSNGSPLLWAPRRHDP